MASANRMTQDFFLMTKCLGDGLLSYIILGWFFLFFLQHCD